MLMKNDFTAVALGAVSLDNPILDTDSYKYSHPAQYPAGARRVSSYVEARKSFGAIDEVVFVGLQAELVKLAGRLVTVEDVDIAEPFLKAHGLGLFAEGWRIIATELGGKLPVLIEALPEGTVVKPGIPQLRVSNTDDRFPWLPAFLETRLLRAVWYPATVASVSRAIMKDIRERMMVTDGNTDGSRFKLHDFGARGVSSRESAAIGGFAHLVNSMGTDTVSALVLARTVYGADMAAFSIPASEHSTMTALGREGEADQMERLLDAYPTGLVACVSDSYDLFHAIREIWGERLREKVLARDGVLVVRPDSGDPLKIVPRVIEALMERFGFDYTPTGYKLLNPKVRVIQGDGVNHESVPAILDAMMARGLAVGNIAFGMGGALLQAPNRDDFGYAMKASAILIGDEWHDVYKDPITAEGSKTSKRGVQGAYRTDSGKWVASRAENIRPGHEALRPVFRDGELLAVDTLDDVRARTWPEGW